MSRVSSPLTVVAAPVPYTDRRALSQAWYSALHLSSRAVAQVHRQARGSPDAPRAAPPATVPPKAARARPAALVRVTARATAGAAGAGGERRAAPSPLARRIVRTLARVAPARVTAPVTVRAGNGRVAVLIRSTPRAVELIALCVPATRPAVERALAEARYALAARGVRLESAIAEARPC